MTNRLIKSVRSRTKGFMLAEALFSLLITILVLSILQNLLLNIKKANLNKNVHVNEIAYAYVQLDRFMHEDAEAVYPVKANANSRRAAFTKVGENGKKETYNIEYYLPKHVLKVSKAGKSGGGFMPLIFNIEKTSFKTKNDQIIIEVTEKYKGKSDLIFQLDQAPDESENKDVQTKED